MSSHVSKKGSSHSRAQRGETEEVSRTEEQQKALHERVQAQEQTPCDRGAASSRASLECGMKVKERWVGAGERVRGRLGRARGLGEVCELDLVRVWVWEP